MQAKFRPTSIALPIALALTAAAAPALAESARHGGVKLSATLSGADEVNAQGVRNQGDADGAGTFSGRLVPGKGQLCYTLTSSGIDAPTMAHIHSGAAGVNGPVFVGFPDLTAGEHCIAVDRKKATALIAKPQNYYVNIHNAAYPAGAVRGQIVKK